MHLFVNLLFYRFGGHKVWSRYLQSVFNDLACFGGVSTLWWPVFSCKCYKIWSVTKDLSSTRLTAQFKSNWHFLQTNSYNNFLKSKKDYEKHPTQEFLKTFEMLLKNVYWERKICFIGLIKTVFERSISSLC